MTAKSGSVTGGAVRTGPRPGGAAGGGRRGRWLLAAAALGTAAVSQPGCGKTTTISVRVVTPPGPADPFIGATTVRMTQGTNQVSAAVTGGKFQVDINLDAPPTDQFLQILVEALDGSATMVARGITPNFDPQNSDVAVYVNRPGQVGATDLTLPDDMVTAGSARGRRDVMGAALSGRQVVPAEPAIGALIVGGAADDGSLVNEAVMYKTLGHQIIDAGTPSNAGAHSGARRGGILVASADSTSGQQALLWGGAQAAGMLPTQADKFDPAVSTLSQVWAAPDMQYLDAGVGTYAPSGGQVGAVYLICGGSSIVPPKPFDLALPHAVVVRRNAPAATAVDQGALLGITRVMPKMDGTGPMVVPRYLHSVTATADGGSGFVFGGLSADDSKGAKPVAEMFSVASSTFKEFVFMPATDTPPSRRGHIAARLTSGLILIAGGYTYDMTGTKLWDSTGLLIEPVSGTVQKIMQILKTPRYAASVTTTGGELVICGGFGADGKALKDCEVLSADSGMPSRAAIPLPNARAGHLALTLENGLTLLVGGVDQNNAALSAIDIYTTLR